MSGDFRHQSLRCAFARCLAFAVGATLVCAPARGGPLDDFNRARNAFTFGNYGDAIRLLTPLLRPPAQLREESQLVEARQLLGVSHYFVRNQPASMEEFERLLYLRPRHELDPLIFPPPVIEFFEKVRARIKDKLALLHPEQRAPAPSPIIVRHVEKRHLVLNFFPLGAGQFQNGKTKKAIFFLSSQLAMLTLNLTTYAVAESRRLADGRFSAADEALAKNLRVTQIVSLAALGALFIGGVIDAVMDYQPETVREERVLPPRPSAQPAPADPTPRETPSPPRSSRDGHRLQWGPWVTAGGGGLAFGFRF